MEKVRDRASRTTGTDQQSAADKLVERVGHSEMMTNPRSSAKSSSDMVEVEYEEPRVDEERPAAMAAPAVTQSRSRLGHGAKS